MEQLRPPKSTGQKNTQVRGQRSPLTESALLLLRGVLHTCGTEIITLNISEVSLLWGLNSKRKEKVSLLERCAHFRGFLLDELHCHFPPKPSSLSPLSPILPPSPPAPDCIPANDARCGWEQTLPSVCGKGAWQGAWLTARCTGAD